ncbi:hypothetical protein LCGC14_2702360, partial [marine sediment metagenome]
YLLVNPYFFGAISFGRFGFGFALAVLALTRGVWLADDEIPACDTIVSPQRAGSVASRHVAPIRYRLADAIAFLRELLHGRLRLSILHAIRWHVPT